LVSPNLFPVGDFRAVARVPFLPWRFSGARLIAGLKVPLFLIRSASPSRSGRSDCFLFLFPPPAIVGTSFLFLHGFSMEGPSSQQASFMRRSFLPSFFADQGRFMTPPSLKLTGLHTPSFLDIYNRLPLAGSSAGFLCFFHVYECFLFSKQVVWMAMFLFPFLLAINAPPPSRRAVVVSLLFSSFLLIILVFFLTEAPFPCEMFLIAASRPLAQPPPPFP